jgi:hypothetical protein
MAIPTIELIEALRKTARKLEQGAPYMWGHMGACNCGNLAQALTGFTKAEIHAFAMRGVGDWSEQAQEYCNHANAPLDLVIEKLLAAGLTQQDLISLERLSADKILCRLSTDKRDLSKNNKSDVILYMNTWANLMEEELSQEVVLPRFVFNSETLVIADSN